MSDSVSKKAQNQPPKLKTEIEEEEPTNSWSRVMRPPDFPPLRNERLEATNWFSSQPSSSSSSRSSHQLNTSFPILSPDGTSIYFGHQHLIGQTCPCHLTQPLPISYILPPIPAQPISACLPAGATDRLNSPPRGVPSPRISRSPGRPVIKMCRPHIKKDARSGRTHRWVEVPDSSVPTPVSIGASSGTSQRADHSFPQEIHETHAATPMSARACFGASQRTDYSFPQEIHGSHAPTPLPWPGVTIRRSDPRRKMTPDEVYKYVFFSPEWEIEERIRQNGKYKGRIEYGKNGKREGRDTSPQKLCSKQACKHSRRMKTKEEDATFSRYAPFPT
ncbi:hypothetical protein NE237_007432 [Protea cynaroides]|uniref:Uncharacterized protein n=1 Tax=Protea cynaroides TaxID=273540 RepID=A0A9Q0KP97_9MAGN|nr:hypothetical protein NE237_007432 [Protea cynaroides]